MFEREIDALSQSFDSEQVGAWSTFQAHATLLFLRMIGRFLDMYARASMKGG